MEHNIICLCVCLIVIQCICLYVILHQPVLITERVITQGLSAAKGSTTVICGLGRNISRNIASKRTEIEELGSYFDDYRVVIVSNNNTDDTLSKLNEWAAENPRVYVMTPEDSEVVDFYTVQKQNTERERQATHDRRIRRMANLREHYLNHVKIHYSSASYMLVMDLDIDGHADTKGFLSNFVKTDWSAVFVNGMVSHRFGWIYRPYDSLAFVSHRTHINAIPTQELRGIQLTRMSMRTDLQWVEVESAFGGYGLYKVADVLNASYVTQDEANCEHHTFHYGIDGHKYINLAWIGRFKSHS